MNIDDETYLQKEVAERMAVDNYAWELWSDPRGGYLMAQALHYAIKAMKEYPHPELSNIADMIVLKQTIFTYPFVERNGNTKEISKA